jgi:PurA ssDNA and RNA-binding protein
VWSLIFGHSVLSVLLGNNMSANDTPLGPRPHGYKHDQMPHRPPMKASIIKAAELTVERKTFLFLLMENERGRFLRIMEQGTKNASSVIIPSSGLKQFKTALTEMLKPMENLPSNPS